MSSTMRTRIWSVIGGSLLPWPYVVEVDSERLTGAGPAGPSRPSRWSGGAASAAPGWSCRLLRREDRLDELGSEDTVAAVDEGLQDHAGRAGRDGQDGLAVRVEEVLRRAQDQRDVALHLGELDDFSLLGRHREDHELLGVLGQLGVARGGRSARLV